MSRAREIFSAGWGAKSSGPTGRPLGRLSIPWGAIGQHLVDDFRIVLVSQVDRTRTGTCILHQPGRLSHEFFRERHRPPKRSRSGSRHCRSPAFLDCRHHSTRQASTPSERRSSVSDFRASRKIALTGCCDMRRAAFGCLGRNAAQLGFFDFSDRYASSDAKKNPLV
jgi:hypothetical protein